MSNILRILMLLVDRCLAATVPGQWNPPAYLENECLTPITPDNVTYNYPASNLNFSFFSSTAAIPPVIGILTNQVLNTNVISEFEATTAGCADECGIQSAVYLKFNTNNSTPPFDPALFYALVITANEPTTFSKLVGLYAIYFRTPEGALQMTAVSGTTTDSLVVAFPQGYDINDQTLVIEFLTTASSNIVTVAFTFPIVSVFNVTVGSELISTVDNQYTSIAIIIFFDFPESQQFTDYIGYPERTTIAQGQLLLDIKEACGRPTALCDSDLDEMRCYSKKWSLCADLSSRCAKVCKAGKCRKSRKACLIRYFTFVSCCLNVFPSLKKRSTCDRLKRACQGSKDRHGVFCSLAALLCKNSTAINVDLRVIIEMMFEVVVGYNPYCHVAKTTGGFYGLCENDMGIVKDYFCDDQEDHEYMEPSEVCEERTEEDEERRHHKEKKRGVFTRFRVVIIVSVAIVAVCGGIAAYSLM